jgi:hypothetical protein
VFKWIQKKVDRSVARSILGLTLEGETGASGFPGDDETEAAYRIARNLEAELRIGKTADEAAWHAAEVEAQDKGWGGWLVQAKWEGRYYYWNGSSFLKSRPLALPYQNHSEAVQIAATLHERTGATIWVSAAVLTYVLRVLRGDSTQFWCGEEKGWSTDLKDATRFFSGQDAQTARSAMQRSGRSIDMELLVDLLDSGSIVKSMFVCFPPGSFKS